MFEVRIVQEEVAGRTIPYARVIIKMGKDGETFLLHNSALLQNKVISVCEGFLAKEFQAQLNEFKKYLLDTLNKKGLQNNTSWRIPPRGTIAENWILDMRTYDQSMLQETVFEAMLRDKDRAYTVTQAISRKQLLNEGFLLVDIFKPMIEEAFLKYKTETLSKLDEAFRKEICKYVKKISVPEIPIYWEEEATPQYLLPLHPYPHPH